MPHTADVIKRLKDRAEECRRLATIVTDPEAARSYLKLAEAYQAMSDQEEALWMGRKGREEVPPISTGPTE